jgi:hypothetical protein
VQCCDEVAQDCAQLHQLRASSYGDSNIVVELKFKQTFAAVNYGGRFELCVLQPKICNSRKVQYKYAVYRNAPHRRAAGDAAEQRSQQRHIARRDKRH